jgi:hypothetical protein
MVLNGFVVIVESQGTFTKTRAGAVTGAWMHIYLELNNSGGGCDTIA